jgi:hypothetical protein
MARTLTPTSASRLAGSAATQPAARTPALSCAVRRARSRRPAHPSSPVSAATQPGSAHACALGAPNDAHAHADQRIPARRASGLRSRCAEQRARSRRPAPHTCALVRRTTRTLTQTSASRFAGSAAPQPGSAGRLRSRLRKPAPECCQPSHACESECPPEKLRLGSVVLPPEFMGETGVARSLSFERRSPTPL